MLKSCERVNPHSGSGGSCEMISGDADAVAAISDIAAQARNGKRVSATMDTYLVFIASQTERIRELLFDEAW